MIPISVIHGEIEKEIKGVYKAEDREEVFNAIEVLMDYEEIKNNTATWIEIGREKEW